MDKNNNLIDFIPSKLIKTYSLQDDDVEVIPSIEKKIISFNEKFAD